MVKYKVEIMKKINKINCIIQFKNLPANRMNEEKNK